MPSLYAGKRIIADGTGYVIDIEELANGIKEAASESMTEEDLKIRVEVSPVKTLAVHNRPSI